MTVQSTYRRAGPFLGNGVAASFPFEFKVFQKSDVRVVRTTNVGLEEDLVLDSDFSVALNLDQDADPGGTVTYPAGGGTALPTGWRLTVVSNMPQSQLTDITNVGRFNPDVVERAFDKGVVLIQQLAEQISRALQVPVSSDQSPAEFIQDILLAGGVAAEAAAQAAASALLAIEASADLKDKTDTSKGISLIGTRLDALGAVGMSLGELLQTHVDVRRFGAKADCTNYGVGTDNRAAFQAAIDYANPRGLEVYVPAGKYRIGAPGLVISNTSGQVLESQRASLRGDGPRGSMLMLDYGVFNGVSIMGQPGNAGSYSMQHLDGLGIFKNDTQGTCLYLDNHYHFSMRNVRLNGGDFGLFMYDVHETNFVNVVITFANKGLFADHNVFTQPNILSFYNCSIGNCREYSIDVHNPATFTYVGGSIEGSQGGTAPVRWACRLLWTDPVGEGTAGATFIGTYLEQNDGVADIWFSNPGVPSTLTLVGVSFQRHVVHTDNCIRFETGGSVNHTLTMLGCGFRGYTEYGYVPSASTKYVKIVDPTRNIKVVDLGNNYVSALERPDFGALGAHAEQRAMASAWVATSNTAGAVANSFAVASVVRNSTGNYTITYAHPLTGGSNAYVVSLLANTPGYGTVIAESNTAITVEVRTFGAVLQDARFSVVVFGGNDLAG